MMITSVGVARGLRYLHDTSFSNLVESQNASTRSCEPDVLLILYKVREGGEEGEG